MNRAARLFDSLHPRQILRALDDIDQASSSYTLDRPAALRRVMLVLACVSVSLLVLHYAKFSNNLLALLGWLGERTGQGEQHYVQALQAQGWLDLCGYIWWTLCHLLTFIALPWLVIRFGFKQSMLDFGWRWNQVSEHWRG